MREYSNKVNRRRYNMFSIGWPNILSVLLRLIYVVNLTHLEPGILECEAAFFSLTKNTCREGSGRSWTEGLCPCGVGVHYPQSTWTRSPPRGSLNPVVQGFIEIPLQRRDLFSHRLLVIKAAPAPSRPGGCGVGLQVSALWSRSVRFLRQPPLSAKNHLVSINSCLVERELLSITKAISLILTTLEIPRVLEALC